MKCTVKISLLFLLFSSNLYIAYANAFPIVSTVPITYSSNTITWSASLSVDRIQVFSNRAMFTNPKVGTLDLGLSSVGLYVQGLNAIVDYFKHEDKSRIQVTGTSGNTGNLTYYYDSTVPPYVKTEVGVTAKTVELANYYVTENTFMTAGLPAVYYDSANGYIKIRLELGSSNTVFIGLTALSTPTTGTSPSEVGGTPIVGVVTVPVETVTIVAPIIPPISPTFPLSQSQMFIFGLGIIIMIIFGVSVYRQLPRNRIVLAWRDNRQKKKKKVKWKKRKTPL